MMMKTAPVIAAVILYTAPFLTAQNSTRPADAQPWSEPTLPPAPTSSTPRPQPDISQLDALFKQTSMGQAADAKRLRLEWRQLRNVVVNDPDLIATKRAADVARSDLKKRDLIRSYYKLFYARMRRLPMSPEMKQFIDAAEAGHLATTAQPRVRPTPTPTPSPSPSPTPSPIASPAATP